MAAKKLVKKLAKKRAAARQDTTKVVRRLRTGDTVQVKSGKDAGKRGTILRVLPEDGRIVVERVGIVKRHTKPRPVQNAQQAARQQQSGGVIEKEAPISASNVMIVCPACDKPTKVGFGKKDDGRKVRVCKHKGCESDIDR
jgi:large subunit ribosomal protein L24